MNRVAAWLGVAGVVASCAGTPSTQPPAPGPAAPPAPDESAAPAPSAAWSAAPPGASASAAASAPPPPASDEEAVKLPEGFVAIAEEGETKCGDLRVQVTKESEKSYERYVRVLGPGDKRVYEAHGRRYDGGGSSMRMDLGADFCGDLTGDKVPELFLTERTMGAHCCYTHYVVSMTSPTKTLLMWEKGDAGTPVVPVKLKPGDAWQLQGLLVLFPPFKSDSPTNDEPAISYAGAPLVPVVFSLGGDEYKLVSLSFPEVYRKERDDIYAACAKDKDCYGQISAWIASVAIGDWERERKNPIYDDMRPALDRRAAALRQMLVRVVGSQQRPAPTRAK